MKIIATIVLGVLYVAGIANANGACQSEYDRLNNGLQLLGVNLPDCLQDGSYAALQCHEAMCKCVTPEGKDLIPYQSRDISRNMNCKCIRAKHEYGLTRRIGKMFLCDETGNYETVQCTGSMCYCTDSNGSQLGTSVHITQKSSLNC